MDQEAWWATVHGVAKSRIWLSNFIIIILTLKPEYSWIILVNVIPILGSWNLCLQPFCTWIVTWLFLRLHHRCKSHGLMVWSLSAWALLSLPNVSLLSLKRKTSNKINICFRNSSDSQFFMKFRPLKRSKDHYSPLENTFFLIAGSRKENVLCPGMSISLLAWRHSPGWDHHMEGVLTNRLTMVSAKGLQCNGGRGRRDFKENKS